MTSTAVVPAAQAIQVYNRDELDLLKQTVAKDTTDEEFKLFVRVCQHTGLDPFAKQIYAIKRWDSTQNKKVMGIQTSIDGFRLIAERTGKYAGQDAPQWCGEDLVWREVWLANGPPAAAKVTVKKVVEGVVVETTAIARFTSYVQKKQDGTPNHMWAQMPDGQIAKCAEALALRKAFPQELSGLYTADEGNLSDEQDAPPPEPTRTVRQPPSQRPAVPAADADGVIDGEPLDLEMARGVAKQCSTKELTAELERYGLETGGTKAERVERLAQHIAVDAPTEEAQPESGTAEEPAGDGERPEVGTAAEDQEPPSPVPTEGLEQPTLNPQRAF